MSLETFLRWYLVADETYSNFVGGSPISRVKMRTKFPGLAIWYLSKHEKKTFWTAGKIDRDWNWKRIIGVAMFIHSLYKLNLIENATCNFTCGKPHSGSASMLNTVKRKKFIDVL